MPAIKACTFTFELGNKKLLRTVALGPRLGSSLMFEHGDELSGVPQPKIRTQRGCFVEMFDLTLPDGSVIMNIQYAKVRIKEDN